MRLLPLMFVLAACGTRQQSPANPAPEQGPGWTGLTKPMDIIHARGEVMEHMELLMEPIDTIQVEPVGNVDQLHINAEAIAAMLLAVPHLFPPTTNLYQPQGPQFLTLALPAIWQQFDTFYGLAMSASQAADAMGEAEGDAALRAASLKLRNSCDACHMLFLRKYVPSRPGPADYDFDFDDALAVKKK
jgi:Cytochrome C'